MLSLCDMLIDGSSLAG